MPRRSVFMPLSAALSRWWTDDTAVVVLIDSEPGDVRVYTGSPWMAAQSSWPRPR